VEPILERGDDAKVPSASTHSPIEVRVF